MKSFWSQDVDHFRLVLYHLRFAFPNEKDGISHCVLIPGCQIAAALCHSSVHLIRTHKVFFSICVKHKAFLPDRRTRGSVKVAVWLGLGPKTSRWGNHCWHFGFVQDTNWSPGCRSCVCLGLGTTMTWLDPPPLWRSCRCADRVELSLQSSRISSDGFKLELVQAQRVSYRC